MGMNLLLINNFDIFARASAKNTNFRRITELDSQPNFFFSFLFLKKLIFSYIFTIFVPILKTNRQLFFLTHPIDPFVENAGIAYWLTHSALTYLCKFGSLAGTFLACAGVVLSPVYTDVSLVACTGVRSALIKSMFYDPSP